MILQLIRSNKKDSYYIAGCKKIIEEEIHNYYTAQGDYEKNYILSVIYQNIQLLKEFS
jgi:hypothetical protein